MTLESVPQLISFVHNDQRVVTATRDFTKAITHDLQDSGIRCTYDGVEETVAKILAGEEVEGMIAAMLEQYDIKAVSDKKGRLQNYGMEDEV